MALIGPNGSGKTSLLRALAGVEMSGGSVAIDGEELMSAPPRAAPAFADFLPASRDLVWPIRARDVVALGLTRPDPQRVDRLLELLELGPFADRPANQLSTGERARVLLARALAPSPRLLLLDEPLSNLDPYWVLKTLELLRETVRATGCSAIVSLHDIDRVGAFDRVLLAERGRDRRRPSAQRDASERRACAKFPDRAERPWLARQAGRRIRDHRRELSFGNDLAIDQRAAGELADAGPLLDELDLEPQKHSRLDRGTEFRALDGHEIDQLAGVREAERFDREHARGLGQGFDDQHAGHDRTPREMPLEEPLVDRHCLDGDDRPVELQRFDPVDEQHRITMRQRRHHPPDIERAEGGACAGRSPALVTGLEVLPARGPWSGRWSARH